MSVNRVPILIKPVSLDAWRMQAAKLFRQQLWGVFQIQQVLWARSGNTHTARLLGTAHGREIYVDVPIADDDLRGGDLEMYVPIIAMRVENLFEEENRGN